MHPREHGFTLIEVLVAFMILALSLTVLMRIFSGGLGNVALAGDYAQALQVAEAQLAGIGVSEPLAKGISEGEWNERFRWQRVVEPYRAWEADPNPALPASAFHVRVRVEWAHKGRTREVSISSLRLLKLKQKKAAGRRRG